MKVLLPQEGEKESEKRHFKHHLLDTVKQLIHLKICSNKFNLLQNFFLLWYIKSIL